MFDIGGAGATISGEAIDPTTAPAPGVLAGPGARLAAAVDALLAVEPDSVTAVELEVAMVDLRREQSRLAAVVADLTAAFDARRVWAEDGSRSAIDWIAVRARLPRPQAAGEVRDARRVRTMPRTRDAWRSGDLNPAHVRTLTRLAGHPRAGEHFPDGEDLLVDEACTSRFDDWERLCAHWRDAADPDGPEQRRARDHDLRRFTLAPGLDGVSHPDGYLTSLATAAVGGALERIEHELFEADWAAAREVHGEATTAAHLSRTPAQRRHDALVEMAVRATAAPADGKRPAPLVSVLVDYPTLAGRVCELAGSGTVVAPGDVAELLGRDDTLIERVVFRGANKIVDVSSARTFRGTLRRVLELIHRRCRHGTCFVPAGRCEGDHVMAWSDGGITAQENGRLLCGTHNRWQYGNSRRGVDPPPPPLFDEPPDPEDWSASDAGDARHRRRRRWRREPVPAVPDLVVDDPFRPDSSAVAVDLGVARRSLLAGWIDAPHAR